MPSSPGLSSEPAQPGSPATLPIAVVTDYGVGVYAGMLHAAALRHAPHAAWIELDHGIAPGDVLGGALVLRRAALELPPCVILAVVDPGVGTDRRAVALLTRSGHLLVGPDNGLLSLAASRLGGAVELVDLGRSSLRRERDSATFDGRDLFGPVAGALAAGTPLVQVGGELAPSGLAGLIVPAPRWREERLEFPVLEVDRFGTLVLALDDHFEALAAALSSAGDRLLVAVADPRKRAHSVPLASQGALTATVGRTFSDVDPGALLLFRDSDGCFALAVNRGSAAELLGVAAGDAILLTLPSDEGRVA